MHARQTDPARLRELIADRRWTLREFQARLGLSYSMVTAVLGGRRDFSDRSARDVAEVLHCTLDDFTSPIAAAEDEDAA